MWLLVVAGIGVIGIVYYWIKVVIESVQRRSEPSPSPKKEGTFSFQRLNDVEGILTVDGRKMKTYNIGEMELDKKIVLRFYDGFDTDVRITDIFFQKQSLYAYVPTGTWEQKAEYAVSVLKQLVNEGKLSSTLVNEVEEIILEVQTLNRHINRGQVVRTDDEGFAWDFSA
jgi:hypothetical protein